MQCPCISHARMRVNSRSAVRDVSDSCDFLGEIEPRAHLINGQQRNSKEKISNGQSKG